MDEMETLLLEKLRGIYSETTICAYFSIRKQFDRRSEPGWLCRFRQRCGETMKIWLKTRDNLIEETGFWTDGCAGHHCLRQHVHRPRKRQIGDTGFGDYCSEYRGCVGGLPQGNFHCAELAANALRAALKDLLSVQQQPWKRLYRK